LGTFEWDKRALAKVEDQLRDRMDVATTHAILAAKGYANIDTTSMIRSIRQLEPILGARMDYFRYVAGGTDYTDPLQPVFYAYFQEIFNPFLGPSVGDFIHALRTKSKRAFQGTGEHIL
jgi:hypothetical protein